MQLLESIFLGMFLVGFLFTLISAFMSGAFSHAFAEGSAFDVHAGDGGHLGGNDGAHMGGDVGPTAAEGHAEVGWAQHNLSTFSPLSPTTLSAFLAAAGGAGWLCVTQWEMGGWSSSLVAVVCGLAFAAAVFFGLTWVFRVTQGTSLVAQSSLVGAEAEVVLSIPSGGPGEVAFVRGGQRNVMQARCADAATIAKGSKVVIKSVSPTVFIVEETRESWLSRTKGQGAKTAS